MIQAWLARRTGMIQVIDRLAALDHELSEAKLMISALTERLTTAEALNAAGAIMNGRRDHQIRALVRVTRAGTDRLRRLNAIAGDDTSRSKALEKEVGRLNAAILIIENRIESEAEQTRRGLSGLLRRIEPGRSEMQADPVE